MLAKELDWVRLERFDGYSDNVFLGEETENLYAGLCVVEKDTVLTKHIHKNGEQVFIIIEGNGIAFLGTEKKEVHAGMFVYIPRNTKHCVQGTSDKPPLKYVYFCNWKYYPGAERSSDGLHPRPRKLK